MMNEESKYIEVQKFNQPWINVILYTVLVADFAVTFLFLLKKDFAFVSFIPLIAALVIFSLFKVTKLTVCISPDKIEYNFKPFYLRNQVINKADIVSAAVVKYEPISEYGGWGVRHSFKKGKALTTRGSYGLQLKLKNGKSILLGTQQPDALQSFLAAYPLSSGVSGI
jgi:hypothetical protein